MVERLIHNLLYWAPILCSPNVYLVGGAVRDAQLDLQPADFDIVVEGDAIGLAWELHASYKGSTFEQWPETQTARVTLLDGTTKLDFAATRTESYRYVGAHPKIHTKGITIHEDLLRRDFTINAMAVPFKDPSKLYAVDHAEEDLSNGYIRVLHTNSFYDDPSRMLRALKYIGKTGFKLHPSTAELLDMALLEDISQHRFEKEFQ